MGVALVTGCSSGIGLETALAFARAGYTTVASMRNPAKANDLVTRSDHEALEVHVVALDVTQDSSVAAAVGAILAEHGSIDVLVNNAGVTCKSPVELGAARARDIFETHIWGMVRMVGAVLPGMRARKHGVIVNVSSMNAQMPGTPYNGFYSASKHALGTLSESLKWEVEPFGIRVVCIEPGLIATAMFDNGDIFGPAEVDPYTGDLAWITRFYEGVIGSAGDARVVASAIVQTAEDPVAPLHVVVGDDAVAFIELCRQGGTFESAQVALTQLVESVAGPRPTPE
jgi:NAD(P)-dependent dehydrogenase (short-subunit alcohol dehydrogenase family)